VVHDRLAAVKPPSIEVDVFRKMVGDRSRYGLLVSAMGAIVLAISVFLPWYGVSFTASGIAFAQQAGDQIAAQFGNATLQSYMNSYHASIGGLAGQQIAAVSAHQVLHDLNILLLVLAGLAMLDSLLPLARTGSPVPGGAGGSVVLLGVIATACVLFRMVDPPASPGGILSLSLREGAWLALLGSIAMAIGGIWPRGVSTSASDAGTGADAGVGSAWSGLSGWTPES
jgi:hypothetical protein